MVGHAGTNLEDLGIRGVGLVYYVYLLLSCLSYGFFKCQSADPMLLDGFNVDLWPYFIAPNW